MVKAIKRKAFADVSSSNDPQNSSGQAYPARCGSELVVAVLGASGGPATRRLIV